MLAHKSATMPSTVEVKHRTAPPLASGMPPTQTWLLRHFLLLVLAVQKEQDQPHFLIDLMLRVALVVAAARGLRMPNAPPETVQRKHLLAGCSRAYVSVGLVAHPTLTLVIPWLWLVVESKQLELGCRQGEVVDRLARVAAPDPGYLILAQLLPVPPGQTVSPSMGGSGRCRSRLSALVAMEARSTPSS